MAQMHLMFKFIKQLFCKHEMGGCEKHIHGRKFTSKYWCECKKCNKRIDMHIRDYNEMKGLNKHYEY